MAVSSGDEWRSDVDDEIDNFVGGRRVKLVKRRVTGLTPRRSISAQGVLDLLAEADYPERVKISASTYKIPRYAVTKPGGSTHNISITYGPAGKFRGSLKTLADGRQRVKGFLTSRAGPNAGLRHVNRTFTGRAVDVYLLADRITRMYRAQRAPLQLEKVTVKSGKEKDRDDWTAQRQRMSGKRAKARRGRGRAGGRGGGGGGGGGGDGGGDGDDGGGGNGYSPSQLRGIWARFMAENRENSRQEILEMWRRKLADGTLALSGPAPAAVIAAAGGASRRNRWINFVNTNRDLTRQEMRELWRRREEEMEDAQGEEQGPLGEDGDGHTFSPSGSESEPESEAHRDNREIQEMQAMQDLVDMSNAEMDADREERYEVAFGRPQMSEGDIEAAEEGERDERYQIAPVRPRDSTLFPVGGHGGGSMVPPAPPPPRPAGRGDEILEALAIQEAPRRPRASYRFSNQELPPRAEERRRSFPAGQARLGILALRPDLSIATVNALHDPAVTYRALQMQRRDALIAQQAARNEIEIEEEEEQEWLEPRSESQMRADAAEARQRQREEQRLEQEEEERFDRDYREVQALLREEQDEREEPEPEASILQRPETPMFALDSDPLGALWNSPMMAPFGAPVNVPREFSQGAVEASADQLFQELVEAERDEGGMVPQVLVAAAGRPDMSLADISAEESEGEQRPAGMIMNRRGEGGRGFTFASPIAMPLSFDSRIIEPEEGSNFSFASPRPVGAVAIYPRAERGGEGRGFDVATPDSVSSAQIAREIVQLEAQGALREQLSRAANVDVPQLHLQVPGVQPAGAPLIDWDEIPDNPVHLRAFEAPLAEDDVPPGIENVEIPEPELDLPGDEEEMELARLEQSRAQLEQWRALAEQQREQSGQPRRPWNQFVARQESEAQMARNLEGSSLQQIPLARMFGSPPGPDEVPVSEISDFFA